MIFLFCWLLVGFTLTYEIFIKNNDYEDRDLSTVFGFISVMVIVMPAIAICYIVRELVDTNHHDDV